MSKILGEVCKQEILQKMFRKILDLKSSSEQLFSENWRWVPLNNCTVNWTVNPLCPKLADKQAIEDELNIDGGKHVLACFQKQIILNE